MLQSSVLEKFIRGRLQEKLKSFFEFESSTIEGLTIRNLIIKPNLLQQLSHVIKVPLILTSGSIESVKLNIPWQSFLSTSKQQPIALVLSGLKIAARLPNQFQKAYVTSIKKKLAQTFSQEFNNKKRTSRLSFLNKLKQHFLGSISIEVRSLEIEVSLQMKHSLVGALVVQGIKFVKDNKTDKTRLEVTDLSLGYRFVKETKIEYIVYKADMTMTGTKTDGKQTKIIETNKLEVSFNNQNFNDIRRIISLVQWHNSFIELPEQLWSLKPTIIGEVEPRKKARYIGNIIIFKVRQNRAKQINENLKLRRKYLRLYENLRREPSNPILKDEVQKMQQVLDMWKIKQYRRFCLLWAKKYPNQPHRNDLHRRQAPENNKQSWLNYWFPKSEQSVLNQLENCLQGHSERPLKKKLTFLIQQVKIAVSIRSLSGKQPFLNVIFLNNEFSSEGEPTQAKNEQGQYAYESVKKVTIHKMYAEYDKYAGHHQNHRYMICEASATAMKGCEEEDQFEEIVNFVQCDFLKQKTLVKIQPFAIKLNEDVIQKMLVFKLERIHNTFQSAETLVLEQNTFEQAKTRRKVDKRTQLQTTIYLTVPETMFEKESQQIKMSIEGISFIKQAGNQSLNIKQVSVAATFLARHPREGDNSTERGGHQQFVCQREEIYLFRTVIQMAKESHLALEQIRWQIHPIVIEIKSVVHMRQLIRLFSKLRPKPKNKKSLYKMKNLRRKQSIGQQFIDACQNLQQHLIRSATLSEKTRHQKYIVKERKDVRIDIHTMGARFVISSSELNFSPFTASVFQFSDYRSISLDADSKAIRLQIHNIKNFLANLSEINSEITRMLELTSKTGNQHSRGQDVELEGDVISVGDLSLLVEVFYEGVPKIVAEVTNVTIEVQRDKNVKCELSIAMAFMQQRAQRASRQRKQHAMKKQYLLEPFKLTYIHEKPYNKDEKSLKVAQLNLNIKPSLFRELGTLFDKLNTPEQLKIQVKNNTLNSISISTTGNLYKQYTTGLTAVTFCQKCDIIVFGKKQMLQLSPESPVQEIKLTPKLRLLKLMKSEYEFCLESNLRITNRQSNIIWIRVLQSSEGHERRKRSWREEERVTFEHLSSAHLDLFDGKSRGDGATIKRSASLHSNKNEDEEEDSYLGQRFRMKKVSIVRTTADSRSLFNQGKPSEGVDSPDANFHHKHSIGSDTRSNQPGLKIANKAQVLFQPILPQQTVQLLSSSEQYFIELVQYHKGQITQRYQTFRIRDVLQDGYQTLLNSCPMNSLSSLHESESEACLVVQANILAQEQQKPRCPIYSLQILSPVVMVNKMPKELQYRFAKEELDLMGVIETGGRQIRKRSFQAIDMQKVEPFQASRVNTLRYEDISQVEISIDSYYKKFRLDHILDSIRQPDQHKDITINDLLCLNNGNHEIQMSIEIRVMRHTLKVTIYPQFILVNLTPMPIDLQVQEHNYNYPRMTIPAPKQYTYYKQYIKMSNQRLCSNRVLQQMFKHYQQNIVTFTGASDVDITRSARYGRNHAFEATTVFNTYEIPEVRRGRQAVVNYDDSNLVIRKIRVDEKYINLLLFMPSLFVINKSDWGFFIKSEGERPKKLDKHSTEYLVINETIAVQACDEHEEIAYNEWMKIRLDTLGIIYYAKEMTSSSGYESREYELRKKRLKKAPKLFFRIVMTKYEYGHQILIEESQYPPVTFISRCRSRIQVRELHENIVEEMELNETAEYASKIPHHCPLFAIAMVDNFEFRKLGEFSLEGQADKLVGARVKVSVEEYKDKKIVIIQDYCEKEGQHLSMTKNDLLLERVERMTICISKIQISILSAQNKELSCASIRDLEISHQKKNTKKYIKTSISDVEILSYHALKPTYLFYFKQSFHVGISKAEVLGLFKRRPTELPPSALAGTTLNTSLVNMSNVSAGSDHSSHLSSGSSQVLSIELVIDYHKHATILEKCEVTIQQLVIVLNANTIIDYLKYFYKDLCELGNTIKRHQAGRMVLKEINNAFNPSRPAPQTDSLGQGPTNTINSLTAVNGEPGNGNGLSTPRSARVHHKVQHRSHQQHKSGDVDIFNRGFVIENFVWHGLRVTIKFENLQNLQYFMTNKEIKYLIKFITWIGDLRPIEFSSTQVSYQQYTLLKLIELIDINKLIKQISETFLQYPLQQFYYILSFVTKLAGINDSDDNKQQWNTLKKITKSAFRISKRIFNPSIGEDTGDRTGKNYVEAFMEENENQDDIVEKIMRFKYEEWRYREQIRQNKLQIKVSRLQRYSDPQELTPYDAATSRIQTALNDHLGNKIFRQISKVLQVSKQALLGITDDWFVLYFTDREEWVVARPEEVIDLFIESVRSKGKINTGLALRTSSKQLVVVLSLASGIDAKKSKIEKYVVGNLLVGADQINEVKAHLADLKLASVY